MSVWKHKNVQVALLAGCAALFVAVAYTSADFIGMPCRSARDVVMNGMQWAAVGVAVWGVVLAAAASRKVFSVVFPLVCLVAAVLAWFRNTAGVVLTPMILDAATDNDLRTSAELVSGGMIAWVAVSLAVAGFFVWRRWRIGRVEKRWVPLASGIFLLAWMLTAPKLRNPIAERIPMNVYFVGERFLEEKQAVAEVREDLSEGAVCVEDSSLVVLILGESLRPDHLGLNGYARNTTPLLEREEVVSLPHVWSIYSYTMRSIPQLLTRASSGFPSLAYTEKSFIHIFRHCGFQTWWLANQEPASTFAPFLHEADTVRYANAGKSVYVFEPWLDEDLLPMLDDALQAPGKRKLVVLHTIGSHWWYNAHFTPETTRFTPVVQSRILSSCTPEEMINSYDNTVAYTDYFLSEVIRRLKGRKAVMIYQSDHGEALGEKGKWLHAIETPETRKAAAMVYLSPRYREEHPEHYQNLLDSKEIPWETTYLFHTMLDAGGIKSKHRAGDMSLFEDMNIRLLRGLWINGSDR